jgi:Erv1 / Alr family
MDNSFWGPAAWRLIHSTAATYTPDKALSFKQFIYSLPGILPCGKCREHLSNNLARVYPLREVNLKNAESLFLWTYHLHDIVNKQLGKTSPPFAHVWTEYFGTRPCKMC